MNFKIENNILFIEDLAIPLTEESMNKLKALCSLDVAAVVEFTTTNHSVFMGPYIQGEDTGFIIQVIDLTSRATRDFKYPFSEYSLFQIKQFMGKSF